MNKITIRVRRIKQYDESTLGKLTIDGVTKSWFVLEPGGPDSTVSGSDKRVKEGAYQLVPYSSHRYPNVYQLTAIPGRTKILLHAGNYHNNTEGCLMPGKTWGVQTDGNYYVGSSRTALNEIFSEISGAKSISLIITNGLGI